MTRARMTWWAMAAVAAAEWVNVIVDPRAVIIAGAIFCSVIVGLAKLVLR